MGATVFGAATSRLLRFRRGPSLFGAAFLLQIPLVVATTVIGLDDTIAPAAYAIAGLLSDVSFVDVKPSIPAAVGGTIAVASSVAGAVVARVAMHRDGTGAAWLLGGLPLLTGLTIGLWFLIHAIGFSTFDGF